MNVDENSFLAIVAVRSLEILRDKNSFSRILRILGLLAGSLMRIRAKRSFNSGEYVDGIAG